MDCDKCKGHGPKHLHSLLEPITQHHPFELLVGDTLSMPKGKRGFIEIRLYADIYSQHVWADKLKTAWINGLIEGMNAKLLGRLKRLCSPDLGEDEYNAMDVPASWPDHLEEAIECPNNCILPNLKFSPNELILGIVINTKHTPADQTDKEVSTDEVEVQMAYVEQQ